MTSSFNVNLGDLLWQPLIKLKLNEWLISSEEKATHIIQILFIRNICGKPNNHHCFKLIEAAKNCKKGKK